MSNIKDQPPPEKNSTEPIWNLVIRDMRAMDPDGRSPTVQAMIRDAEDRDQIGRQRYGTPLQANNGRDALVDAYQESQDLTAYLRQACAEGVEIADLYEQSLHLLRDLRVILTRSLSIGKAAGAPRCGFCGRCLDSGGPGPICRLVRGVYVCHDPVPIPDKPTVTPCAWKFCARATGGEHNFEGDAVNCHDCGRPREVKR